MAKCKTPAKKGGNPFAKKAAGKKAPPMPMKGMPMFGNGGKVKKGC